MVVILQFFASNGIEVESLDYFVAAIEILDKIAKEKKLMELS
jgi:hypothetical protein